MLLLALLLAADAKLVAVLEIKNKLHGAEKEAVDSEYLTDVVRSSVLQQGKGSLRVMTRENILVLLHSQGKKLEDCEGECEVDTGRRLGADLIITGDVLKFGTNFKLNLRLHDTGSGQLIAGQQAGGATADELDKSIGPAVLVLIAPLLEDRDAAAAAQREKTAAAERQRRADEASRKQAAEEERRRQEVAAREREMQQQQLARQQEEPARTPPPQPYTPPPVLPAPAPVTEAEPSTPSPVFFKIRTILHYATGEQDCIGTCAGIGTPPSVAQKGISAQGLFGIRLAGPISAQVGAGLGWQGTTVSVGGVDHDSSGMVLDVPLILSVELASGLALAYAPYVKDDFDLSRVSTHWLAGQLTYSFGANFQTMLSIERNTELNGFGFGFGLAYTIH